MLASRPILATAAACGFLTGAAWEPTSRPPVGSAASHLYTVVYLGQGYPDCRSAQVERFPFVGDRLAKQPDLRYPHVTWPIATDNHGNLYSQGCVHLGNAGKIYVFPFGSTTPSRIISLAPGGNTTQATALAVDSAGYLYVGYTGVCCPTSSPHRSRRTYPNQGIFVYPPGAEQPSLAFDDSGPSGLTLDGHGNLYVAPGSGNARDLVDVYANPETNPQRVRSITGPWWFAGAGRMSIDAFDLYTKVSGCCTPGSIAVYHNDVLIRTIKAPRDDSLEPGLAIRGGLLYAAFGGGSDGDELVGFDKTTNGVLKLIDEVHLDGQGVDLALGQ